jgi:hypothetical protein
MVRPIAESGAIQEISHLIWEISLIQIWDITVPSLRTGISGLSRGLNCGLIKCAATMLGGGRLGGRILRAQRVDDRAVVQGREGIPCPVPQRTI